MDTKTGEFSYKFFKNSLTVTYFLGLTYII